MTAGWGTGQYSGNSGVAAAREYMRKVLEMCAGRTECEGAGRTEGLPARGPLHNRDGWQETIGYSGWPKLEARCYIRQLGH